MHATGEAAADRRAACGGRFGVLVLLAAVNAFNHLDRQIVSIVLEPIRAEFALSDIQLGLLSGLAFALLYTTLSIPAALWAVSHSRVNLVAASAALWGAMTLACGLAQNFGQLLLARVGVGVGEAGCQPAGQAMVSDLYRPGERSGAMAFFSAGVNAGVFLAFLVGGVVGQFWGWRAAFLVAGAATLVLALIVRLSVREPLRTADRPEMAADGGPSALFAQTARLMWADPVLRNIALGAMLTAATTYGTLAWLPSFLVRSHGVGIAQAGIALSLIAGIGGFFGTWLGGTMSDRLRRRDLRWTLWFVALGYLATKPLSAGFYLADGFVLAMVLFALPAMTAGLFQGPAVATIHERVPSHLRPVASAIFLVLINLIGFGLGPLIAGVLSQFVFASLGEESLRWALLTLQVVGVWGGLHFWLSGSALGRSAA